MTMPMMMSMPRCQCRDFQMPLKICQKSYNIRHFCRKRMTLKKQVFKFIPLTCCLCKLTTQKNPFKRKPLVNIVLKKFDTKHIVTDNFSL